MNFQGRKVVITGASSGIGAGIAREIAARGGEILAVSRSIKHEDFPYKNIKTANFDLKSRQGVDGLFEYAMKELGGIDIFIANAGYGYYGKTDNPDWEKIQNIYSLNVFSPIYSLEKMCGLYPNEPFYFVTTASVAGKLPLPGFSLYCSTKFALDGFMRTFRLEMPKNAKLSVIYPISTGTDFFAKSGNGVPAPGPVQPLENAVKNIIKGLEKEKKEIFPSGVYNVLNVSEHIFPPAVSLFIKSEKKRFNKWCFTHNSKKDGTV